MGDGLLVVGAKLKCSHGSDTGPLKLPNCHGVFVKGRALINEDDARYPDNIPNFGICEIKKANGAEDITCKPRIIEERWRSTESTWIVSGKPAVTVVAACLCDEGGLIQPETTGQCDILAALFDQMDKAWLLFGLKHGLFSGDPININTGNFVDQKTDLLMNGINPLELYRTYNALDKRSGAMGKGWRHSFEVQLENKKDTIEITWGDGRGEVFHATYNGRYISGKAYINRIPRVRYELTTESGDVYTFNETGKCTGICDRNGSQTTFCYENGRLSFVENTSGSLLFKYNECDYISAVVDSADRMVHYTYDKFGTLVGIEDVQGLKLEYVYDKFDRLLASVDPTGEPDIINKYDKKGRVAEQHFADGGVMSFEYDEHWNKTTLTEQNGNRIRYYQNAQMQNIKTVYSDGHEETECDDSGRMVRFRDKNGNESFYKYDPAGNLVQETNPLGADTHYEYNKQNLQTKITAANESTVQLAYDKNKNLTSIINPLGHCTAIQYYKGLPSQVDLPDGGVLRASFDERLNVSSVSLPTGAVLQYEYDRLNRVSAVIDANGGIARYSYNDRDEVVQIVNADGKVQTYEYTPRGLVSKITGFDGGVVEYKYNSVGKVEELVNQAGDSTTLTYDLMQNISSVTDACGNTTKYSYDKLNRLIEIVDAEGNATKYEHDPKGNVIAVISPLGARTEVEYDALDRQTKVTQADGAVTEFTYDVIGNLTEVWDALGNVTKHKYDLAGQLIGVTDALGNKTELTYTPLGKVASITNAKGEQQTYNYYPGGLLKSSCSPSGAEEHYEYDNNENPVKKTDALGNVTAFTYDSLNRMTAVRNPLGHSKQFSYDALGNITQMTDELGNVTTYKYSPLGNIIEVVDATGHSTKYEYDKVGRMTKLEQLRLIDDAVANVQVSEYLVTTYEYDKNGKIIATKTPLGTMEKFAYDAAGNLVSKLDGNGLETLYEYNLAGQLTKTCYADGKNAEFFYNPLRQMTMMQDWLGTTQIELDPLGRATQVTDYTGNTVGYTWDSVGRREKTIYPDGKEVSYNYNTTGLLEKVLAPEGETRYTYDTLGRLQERILPEGIRSRFRFDPLGRIAELTHSNQHGHLLDQMKYAYDPLGNITQIKKERERLDADSGLFEYAYDPLGRLTSTQHGKDIQQFSYDSLGNRIQSQQNGLTTNYAYNAANQLIHTQAGDVIHDYSYDKRGNLIQISENGAPKQRFTFDATNRMVTAMTSDVGQAEYAYDGLLNRVKRSESTSPLDPMQEIRYTLDRTLPYNNLLMTEGAENQCFTWGNGLISASTDSKSMFYLQDHLGSPIRLMHNYDSPLAYDAFGMQTAGMDVSSRQPFGFTGYQTDAISGLHFAQARYYDANVGRFTAEDTHWHPGNMVFGDGATYSEIPGMLRGISPDRLAIGQSGNLYAHCLSNPVNSIDPDGESILGGVLIFGGYNLLKWVGGTLLTLGTVGVAYTAADYLHHRQQQHNRNNRGGSVAAPPPPVPTPTYGEGLLLTAAAGIIAMSGINQEIERLNRRRPGIYTVYHLVDVDGVTVRYVGRTRNPEIREATHLRCRIRGAGRTDALGRPLPPLEFRPMFRNLTYVEARAREQAEMIRHHTLNSQNAINNQIRGIGPNNPNIRIYSELNAVRNFITNQLWNEFLNRTGQ